MPSLSQPHEKACPGRARLGTVSAREAGVAMFANKTRILLTFREDVLGRARVFPGLELAEHQMLFANACRGASGSGEIRSGGGWRRGPREDNGFPISLSRTRPAFIRGTDGASSGRTRA